MDCATGITTKGGDAIRQRIGFSSFIVSPIRVAGAHV
jgi:hypothetical protein